jgi:hypothetical protein
MKCVLCLQNKGYCQFARLRGRVPRGFRFFRRAIACAIRSRLEPSSSSKQVRVFRITAARFAVMEPQRRPFDSERVERAKGKTSATSCLRSDLGGKSSYSKIVL